MPRVQEQLVNYIYGVDYRTGEVACVGVFQKLGSTRIERTGSGGRANVSHSVPMQFTTPKREASTVFHLVDLIEISPSSLENEHTKQQLLALEEKGKKYREAIEEQKKRESVSGTGTTTAGES